MIYLDCAATSLEKPRGVADTVARSITRLASPGRGGHRPAMEAGEILFQCRLAAARLFGLSDPERVVFTFNATHALNIAIKSLVRPGDSVLISGYEHNAVTRPLEAISGVKKAVVSSPLFRPDLFLEEFDRKLTGQECAVVCTQVSNVFGYILPIGEVAALCRERGVPLIVDASQAAGCLPVEPETWGAAFVAMPGHKGLFGPQGTGLLLCGDGQAVPLLEGGTGSVSLRQTMPDFLPDRLEAGTHNVPGIAGLLEGLRFVEVMGTDHILAHERGLTARAARGLAGLGGVEVFCGERSCQSGVCSFRCAGLDCETVGELLGERGVAVRAGLHCAPLAHRTAGTMESGTVRLSVSPFNTEGEVDQFLEHLEDILHSRG